MSANLSVAVCAVYNLIPFFFFRFNSQSATKHHNILDEPTEAKQKDSKEKERESTGNQL
jgi:hypothetical protein